MPLHSTYFTPACVAFIKQWQGLSLEKYQDKNGVWVIGYGHEITSDESFPAPVSVTQAETLLLADLEICEEFIHQKMPQIKERFQQEALIAWMLSVGISRFVLQNSARGYFTARIVLTVKYSPVKLRRLTSLPPAYGFLPRGADTAIQDGL